MPKNDLFCSSLFNGFHGCCERNGQSTTAQAVVDVPSSIWTAPKIKMTKQKSLSMNFEKTKQNIRMISHMWNELKLEHTERHQPLPRKCISVTVTKISIYYFILLYLSSARAISKLERSLWFAFNLKLQLLPKRFECFLQGERERDRKYSVIRTTIITSISFEVNEEKYNTLTHDWPFWQV